MVLVTGDADAMVLNAEMKFGGLLRKLSRLDLNSDFTVLGELNRVSDKIC